MSLTVPHTCLILFHFLISHHLSSLPLPLICRNFYAWEVSRQEEFSPLKNADGAKKDTPSTARQSLYQLHRAYIEKAGGTIVSDDCGDTSDDGSENVVEISPLLSYDGEDLDKLVKGKTFKCPIVLSDLHSVPNCIKLQDD